MDCFRKPISYQYKLFNRFEIIFRGKNKNNSNLRLYSLSKRKTYKLNLILKYIRLSKL